MPGVFKTVCVDAAYYTYPSQQQLEGMVNQKPDEFVFGLKVTDTITMMERVLWYSEGPPNATRWHFFLEF